MPRVHLPACRPIFAQLIAYALSIWTVSKLHQCMLSLHGLSFGSIEVYSDCNKHLHTLDCQGRLP